MTPTVTSRYLTLTEQVSLCSLGVQGCNCARGKKGQRFAGGRVENNHEINICEISCSIQFKIIL